MGTKSLGRGRGKVALTGSSSEIGRACAVLLAAEGAAVAVTDILDAEGQGLANKILQDGGTVGYWHLDVANERQVLDVVKMVRARFGPISILINALDRASPANPLSDMDLATDREPNGTSVCSAVNCTKHVIPQMIEAGTGSIVNIHTSKSPPSISENAIEQAPLGISVNSICYRDEVGARTEDVANAVLSLAIK